jgi:hypothetical protein
LALFWLFSKNEIWPYLVEFGLFLKVIWLCACAKAYQPYVPTLLVTLIMTLAAASVFIGDKKFTNFRGRFSV